MKMNLQMNLFQKLNSFRLCEAGVIPERCCRCEPSLSQDDVPLKNENL